MRRLFFAYAWILVTTGVILTGIAGLQVYHFWAPEVAAVDSENPVKISAAPTSSGEGQVKGVETIVESEDARAILVANFLKRHKSPLEPAEWYGQKLVEIADKYGIDFRLVPAIAMQESNLCKVIPEGSYNCLGFGVHSKGTLAFDSYEANFDRAARELKAYYIDQGRTTPEEIMKKYTPGSNGSWAESVNQWMAEMKYDDRQMGREASESAHVLEYVPESPQE